MNVLKTKVCIALTIVSLIVMTFICNVIFSKPHKHQVKAENGVLDLTDWDFKKDGIVSLDGEWEFYWDKLLTYDDFYMKGAIEPDGYFNVPSVWTNYTLNNKKFPEMGHATYKLKVKTNNVNSLKGLKIFTVSTSYKLMISNKVVAQNGIVGKTQETTVPEFRPQAVSFENSDKDFDIIIQVSNYTYSRGGMWHSIYLGNDNDIRNLKELNSEKAMFLFGVAIIMSLYHMILFFLQKRNKSALYFALVLLIIAIRIIITGEYLISNFISFLSVNWMVPIEYMTMYWGAIIAMAFVHELYPKKIPKKIVKICMYTGVIVSLFTFFTPISVFTRYLILYEILMILIYVYIGISIVRAVIKKREEALLMLLSVIIILCGFINDVLYYWNMKNDKYGPSVEIATFIVIFIQAYILAKRFSLAFEKVERLSDRLISLSRIKDEFLTNTSNKFKTPLNEIINITQSLLKGAAGQLNLNQEENLQVISDLSRQLYNLINDIIDISNLKHDELKVYLKPMDIRMIVEKAIVAFEYLKGEKKISFKNLIPKNMPKVLCDEEQMEKIFYNLLENSLKFTESGYIKISAELGVNHVTIFVEDTGMGIEEKRIDSIFESFIYSNDLTNKNHYRTGIGLAITKQLIELQGGQIDVKSQYGKGSCFFFTLPLAKEQLKNSLNISKVPFKIRKNSLKSIEKKTKLNKYNILIIEYDAASLIALSNNLYLAGYTVQAVESGYEALKFMDNGINFDVVILNTIMPDISGYDILKKIREKYLPVELPVLLLINNRNAYDVSTGFRLGANDYITKPFEIEELTGRVKSLINMKNAVSNLVTTELAFLQAQIKPHFIYNALSVISSLSLVKPVKAKELILDLSDYLRGSFDFESKEGLTTLKRELNLVKAYLSIEQARFKERLCVEFETDDVSCTVPMLSIQPLVENAVRHGVMPMIDGGKILISIKNEGEYIRISVRDNGVGIDEKKLNDILSGKIENGSVGIKNIHSRLIKLYGSGINISKGKENGTNVEFKIPLAYKRGNLGE